ncbi:MAG: O-antigen ligase family protein, partial [Ghiorsea sp.]|nr:O-antigen ligase family protein [Ghiorsea sp.]
GYLMFMFSVVLGILLYTTSSKQRYLLLFILGIIFVPFIFTESRSSYLSFFAAIMFFLFFSPKKKLLIFFCLGGIALAPFVIPKSVSDRILFTFNQSEQAGQLDVGGITIDTSTTERLKSWEKVLTKSFPNNPFFGVGVTGGGFLDAQYPRVLLESGMIGLVLFIWFLRRVWVVMKRSFHEITDPVMRGVALGALCGYGGLLVHAIGANTFIIVRIMEPFMIILGLILAMRILENTKKKKQEEDNSV